MNVLNELFIVLCCEFQLRDQLCPFVSTPSPQPLFNLFLFIIQSQPCSFSCFYPKIWTVNTCIINIDRFDIFLCQIKYLKGKIVIDHCRGCCID